MRRALPQAVLTGAFCVVFAAVIDRLTDMVSLVAVLSASFVSGFLGSLLAQTVLRGGRGPSVTVRDRDELE